MTTEDLIAQIKRRVSVPASQLKYGNADFIAFLDNAIASKIVPKLIDIDEGYFVNSQDIPLVASQTKYRIPDLAVCWTLHEVGYLDTNGLYSVLPRITRGTEQAGSTDNRPYGFYLEDGYIVTTPDMGTTVSGSIRAYFYRRLNSLALAVSCGQVNTVTSVGVNWQLTVDSVPVGIGAGNPCDVTHGSNPYELISYNSTNAVVGFNVTIAKADFDDTPQVGDWVSRTGYTPIPHLPDAWHYLLADFGARKCMIGNVDAKTLQLLDSDIADDIDGIKRVTQSRAKGSPRKRVARNYFLAAQRRRY